MSFQNGWDPNDMFRTNEEKFNVQTKYDESLTQYTWVWLFFLYKLLLNDEIEWIIGGFIIDFDCVKIVTQLLSL